MDAIAQGWSQARTLVDLACILSQVGAATEHSAREALVEPRLQNLRGQTRMQVVSESKGGAYT